MRTLKTLTPLCIVALFFSLASPHATLNRAAAVNEAAIQEREIKEEDLIVPGKRMGKISLGMSAPDLFRAMGEPAEAGEFANGRWYRYGVPYKETVATILNKTSRVTSITTRDSRLATAEGIRVGDSELTVEAKLGDPQRRYYIEALGEFRWWYKRLSIEFAIKNGKVTDIAIPYFLGFS